MGKLNIKTTTVPANNGSGLSAEQIAQQYISLTNNNYAHSRKNNHQKFFMKLHEIARLSVASVKDDQICYLLNINRNRLSCIRRMPEFIEIQQEEFNQHMQRMSGQLAARVDIIRTQLSNGVPEAINTIKDCMRGKDLRVRLEAAKHYLEIEGTFSKNRGSNGLNNVGGFNVPDSVFSEAQAIGDSIAKAPKVGGQSVAAGGEKQDSSTDNSMPGSPAPQTINDMLNSIPTISNGVN